MMGSSYQLNNEEIQYLDVLCGMIGARNWQAFGYAILNNPTVFQSFSRKISQSSEMKGLTILHACIRYNPPPHIVKIILTLVPEVPGCVDCFQRTPLHVAAGTRASLPVIELLAKAYPRACDIQDKDGKTPLHLACDCACNLFEGDGDFTREPPSYEVVYTLLKNSPLSTVPVEDHDGMSALEHAILSDASIEVVNLLQYATGKQCEWQQKINGLTKKSRLSQDSISVIAHETSAVIIIPARKGEISRKRGVHENLLHV